MKLTAISNYYSATLPHMPATFRPTKGQEPEAQAAAVQAIESAVCAFYGLSPEEMNSHSRKDETVMARHIVRYLLHLEGIGIRPLARIAGKYPSHIHKSISLVKGYIDTGGRVKLEICAIKTLLAA